MLIVNLIIYYIGSFIDEFVFFGIMDVVVCLGLRFILLVILVVVYFDISIYV